MERSFTTSTISPLRKLLARSNKHSKKTTKTHTMEEMGRTVRQKTIPERKEKENVDTIPENTHIRRSSSMPSVCEPDHPRSSIRHYPYDSNLNKIQKKSLRFTWHRLQTRNGGKRVEKVFEEIFERLLKHHTVLKDMFTTRTFLCAMSRSDNATPRDHAREIVRMIEHVLRNLDVCDRKRNDTGSEYDPFLIGKAHGYLRPYGFLPKHWEALGETIIDVLLSQEAVRDLPGAGQAWVVLTACLVDQLRAGFDESKNLSHSSKKLHQLMDRVTFKQQSEDKKRSSVRSKSGSLRR